MTTGTLTPTDPPPAETEIDSGNRDFLQIAMGTILVGCLAGFLLVIGLAPEHYRRLIGLALAALAAAATLWALRRGDDELAYRILTYGLWCGLTTSATINGGMAAPAILAYPVLILIAGWVMGTRTVLILTGLSVGAELLFVIGAASHVLPDPLPAPAFLAFLVHALILTVSASLALFVRRSFAARFAEIARRDAALSAQHALLREIVEGTARTTGTEFFHALVQHLARALDVPFALVGEVRPGEPDKLHTLAFWAHDGFAAALDYDLATTPCGQVFGQQPRLFAQGLSRQFPQASCMIDALGADSYCGVPLTDAAGAPLGVLAIMDKHPLAESEERASLMSIFAARAAAELERQRAEAAGRLSEEKYRELNAELEERVRRRTADLTEANRELESFAYSISHDLRAPLRGIDGFSRLLQEEYGERLDQQGTDYLVRVRRAAQRLGTLIDDLLDLSRVTRHEMRRVKVDLSALATDIVDNLRRAEPERNVTIEIKHRCASYGDPRLLRVLLENLIDNAWKYSRYTEEARIEFGTEATGKETVYCVRDNGAGFDMAYADKLFVPFQRLHNPADFQGSGVGLASAARVVRRHGGKIWAESAPDQGAVFRFTLGNQ